MAVDANPTRHGTNIGSGRVRLPTTVQFDTVKLGPGYTTTQKNALTGMAEGDMIWDKTLHKACVYSGTAWETVTSA
jgi:hypothetical protein